jgi:hypothetical protein
MGARFLMVLAALPVLASAASASTESALKDAAKAKKHFFALFVRAKDEKCDKMRALFAEAQRQPGERAIYHVATVSDKAEAAFIRKYRIDRAPLPLTLVFAPNGAVVKAFEGEVVTREALDGAYASPLLADTLKALQEQRIVLLCVQGKATRHNKESLDAAQAVVRDEKARDYMVVMQVALEDDKSADLMKPLEVAPGTEEPPSSSSFPPAGSSAR